MPSEADEIRQIWASLDLPGIIDVHTHFMPKRVMDKVWAYFDSAGEIVWPITYRLAEADRLEMLRGFGVRGFTSLVYPHKPEMAEWLNQWTAEFARATPDCLATATFYPEPEAPGYVADVIAGGARIFKVHLQVGDYDPNDPMLDDVWAKIGEAGLPVVIHCGSGPQSGRFTGPEPIRALLRRHPGLRLVIAHMGMPEYVEFLDICEAFEHVRLDTTLAFTNFTEQTMPFPRSELGRVRRLGRRILFGSDFPNIPYPYVDAVVALTRVPDVDDDWLRNVLYRNAAQLFRL